MESTRGTVCRACLALVRRPRTPHTKRSSATITTQHHNTSRSASTTPRPDHAQARARTQSLHPGATHTRPASPDDALKKPFDPVQSIDLNQLHARIQELSTSVLRPTDGPIPPEQRILYVLEQLESLSTQLLDTHPPSPLSKPKRPLPSPPQPETATSALLGSVNTRIPPPTLTRPALLSHISAQAELILRHPHTFITPPILHAYVSLQTHLSIPSSLPEIFSLYAHKPVPRPGPSPSSPVSFTPPRPSIPSSAIPAHTASLALLSATHANDLPLALDIIDSSFATPAFRRAKALRRAGVPLAGILAAPPAAYSLATQFSNVQMMMDPGTATAAAFAGIMTYVGAVGAVGYVAVTTANDQMERVTWATGVPLWERWVREEERAAVDGVAVAWGFVERGRRGEEEGGEWEGLKEWVGERGMVLDRVSLMEGME